MRRCIIFGGAKIRNYAAIRKTMLPDDFIICCDSGLEHAKALEIMPDLVIGDFDSHENPHLLAETIVLPAEKDDTDTAYAVKEALRRGFTDFLMAGVIGQRLDHTMVNLCLLTILKQARAHAVILDDYGEISLVTDETDIHDDCAYFSLIPFNGRAEGVTITGAKYPLENGTVTVYDPYASSNEVLPGKTAHVTVKSGMLLLIIIRKED